MRPSCELKGRLLDGSAPLGHHKYLVLARSGYSISLVIEVEVGASATRTPPEKLPPPYGRADSGARYEIQIGDIRDVSGQHAVARGLPAGLTAAATVLSK